jgi:hypothetical protein
MAWRLSSGDTEFYKKYQPDYDVIIEFVSPHMSPLIKLKQ